jgi:hypothetical protein
VSIGLIIKANKMHYFSNLFDKELCTFWTGPLSIIRSISTLVVKMEPHSILTTLADSQQIWHDKYLLRVYSVEILLMMDSGPVRNM